MFLSINDSAILTAIAAVSACSANIWMATRLAKKDELLERTNRELQLVRSQHDQEKEMARETGQALACLCVQLNVAQKLKTKDPSAAYKAIDTCRDLAVQSLNIVRKMI